MGTWKYSVSYRDGVTIEVTAETKTAADNTVFALVHNDIHKIILDDQGKEIT